MDDLYVLLSILALVLIIFVILFAPSPFAKFYKETPSEETDKIKRIKHPPVVVETPDKSKLVCFDPRMQSLNSRKKGDIGTPTDEESLASFYVPSKDHVPEDFPVKQIGECPYSKAQQHDIPVAHVNMCLAAKEDYNMRVFHKAT